MSVPSDRRYLQTHEWHKLDGDTVTIGITQFAADELTDITYVAMPKVGDKLSANQRFGEIESVKATSDLYTGVSGTVAAVNDQLAKNPGLVNSDPYNCGACGNVCTALTPICSQGTCGNCGFGDTNCGGVCTNTDFDNQNCGACGVVCGPVPSFARKV